MKLHRHRPALLVLAACTAACTTTVPTISPAPMCDVLEAKLKERCANPGTIGLDVTYNDVIGIAITDRSNLRQCANMHKELAEAITACNSLITEHNKRLEQINAQTSKR